MKDKKIHAIITEEPTKSNRAAKSSFSKAATDEINIHSGHRERVFCKFRQYGIESFNDHQLLEFLLFFVLPRVDTNVIAHRLINKFKTAEAVFDASEKELCQIPGIGKKSAEYLNKLGKLKYESQVLPEPTLFLLYDRFIEFCASFATPQVSASVVFFDNRMNASRIVDLPSDVNTDWTLPPKLLVSIIRKRPRSFMLIVSCNDRITDFVAQLTDYYYKYLTKLQIPCVDAIIVHDGIVKQCSTSNMLDLPDTILEYAKKPKYYTKSMFVKSDLLWSELQVYELGHRSGNHEYRRSYR